MRTAIVALCLVSAPVLAQSEAQVVQRVINNSGERCDRVANFRLGGAFEDGDVLIIADCSDGSSHVLRLTDENRVSYYMSCDAFANPVDC